MFFDGSVAGNGSEEERWDFCRPKYSPVVWEKMVGYLERFVFEVEERVVPAGEINPDDLRLYPGFAGRLRVGPPAGPPD